jgi:hypothetical protein
MTLRFGLGFEEKSEVSPSTQHARASFLMLLPRLKPGVVPALFKSTRLPFLNFIKNSEDEIHSINSDLASAADSTEDEEKDSAIRIFVRGWWSLTKQRRALGLRRILRKWAYDHNLNKDWCLDHAVSVLREQRLGALDNAGVWHDAIIMELKLGSISIQDVFTEKFRREGLDKYSFNYDGISFTVEGPMFISVPEFKQQVEQAFSAAGGHRERGAKTALQHTCNDYLDKVIKFAGKQNFTEPQVRWAEDHFTWLVQHLVPPDRKTVRELSIETGKDRKTVREGINDVAKLIGLDLVPVSPEAYRARAGRPSAKV